MASIDKRNGGCRVRCRDPLGHQRTRQFRRKTDADRFAREVEVDKDRGSWIDPRGSDIPLAEWVETFMSLARSLAPTTQETYRRDLDRYVLPRLGARRLGHIDLRRRKVRVTEQLVQLSDRSRVRREPKTSAGVRSITISATTVAIIDRHLHLFAAPGADALVFTNGSGSPITHSSFHTHHFKPALAAAGVASRFHDLRHTSVALAISAGAHPKAIQVRMGHSSITVTLDRYGHLFPELDEAIADAFDQRWLDARTAAGLQPA